MPSTASTPLEALLGRALARLAEEPIGGYHPHGEAATEPTAWATIALGRSDARFAHRGADWLAERQARNGSVGVTASQESPYWPTALAMLAWEAVDADRYADRIRDAASFALSQAPKVMPHNPKFGHDTMLEGWSWAPDTHSWLEPTAFFSVALRETGHADEDRRSEAVRLLADRMLPSGGANYGNTVVFGQELLQHTQSSGVVAWALAGEQAADDRLERTLDFLTSSVRRQTGVASLSWAVRGLAAHGRADESIQDRLVADWPRVEASGSLHKLALFTLAAQEATRS